MKISTRMILSVIILFFVFVNFIFIILDKVPVHWDAAWYLSTSIRLYRGLVLGNLFIFLKAFSHAFGDKAPLISILPMPFYLIFGVSYYAAMLVNICFIALLSLYTFKLVRYCTDSDRSALFSVFIINTLPLFHIYARDFMVEYGLSTFVIMSVYYLIKSDYLKNDKYVNKLGPMLGLGLLMKSIYPLFMIGVVAVILISAIRHKPTLINKNFLRKAVKIIFIGIAIASIWYTFNLKSVLLHGAIGGYGARAKAEYPENIFDMQTIMNYLRMFVRDGISQYYFVLFLSYFLIFLIRRRVIKIRFKYDVLIAIWFLLPFSIFLFAPNKTLRYLLPALAPIAIILGIWTDRIFRKKGCIFLLPPLIAFILNPFVQAPLFYNLFNPPKLHMDVDWKIEQLLNTISTRGNGQAVILCGADHHVYNNFTLDYYSILRFLPYSYVNTNLLNYIFREDAENKQLLKDLINNVDFILIKTEYLGSEYTNRLSQRIRSFVLENKSLFNKTNTYDLPDGSSLLIYEKLQNK